jgi:hypothetical protein
MHTGLQKKVNNLEAMRRASSSKNNSIMHTAESENGLVLAAAQLEGVGNRDGRRVSNKTAIMKRIIIVLHPAGTYKHTPKLG